MKTVVWFGFVLGALSAAAKVILTSPGHKSLIECAPDTFTSSLEWYHGSNLIVNMNMKQPFPRKGTIDIAGRSRVKHGTNLEISGVKEEDAGQFTCTADGKSEEHTLLVVSVSTNPSGDLRVGSEATIQCRVKGLNTDSVQWKGPDGSPHAGSGTVQLKPVARSDAGTWQCTFSHAGVPYSQSLDIKVHEPTPKTSTSLPSQSSKDVPKSTCRDCATGPSSALLLGLSWWVWAAVGAGCLVVVLLLVFVIVLCKRIRRRKRKLRMMKNGYQLPKPKEYCQCNRPTAAEKLQQGRRREKPSGLPLQPLQME